jgi:2,3-bisphosphoglycerate-dependent phosphoglycerate mutase
MAAAGLTFDMAYTSLLSRAIKTLWLSLEEMDLMWLPVTKHWRLNERHYGKLQGTNKKEAVAEFGEEQVQLWRRSYATPPPPVDLDSPEYPKADPRYAGLRESDLPRGESLKDVLARVMPYWEETILPQLKAGKRVLIAAHGNSLRALIKHLENVSDNDIAGMDIPTGVPKAYRLDASFKCVETRYLLDAACRRLKIPLVYGAVHRFTGQVSVFDARRDDSPCYRCLFPEPPSAAEAPNCSEAGVLGVLPGVIGLLQATEAIKLVLGIGETLVGRLLCYDALAARFRELRLPRDPACPGCSANAAFDGYEDLAALCAG